ncbi:hypothetical protein [Thermanaeromonas toyohensis]|uniref:hypothetical protein n=1 Tax=Thermanaeromonas toyohensis TaxID=161154 RepID=UPI0009FD30C8|nr:hypothetical protein [Thermanaeromonas toyohensis]
MGQVDIEVAAEFREEEGAQADASGHVLWLGCLVSSLPHTLASLPGKSVGGSLPGGYMQKPHGAKGG